MRLSILLLLFACLACAGRADAAERTVVGRIVDAKGKGVPNVTVATAWTVSPSRAEALRGVTTDEEGRFTIVRDRVAHPVVLLALDAAARNGAVLTIHGEDAGKVVEGVLQPCVRVHGALSSGQGKYYPAGAYGWVTLERPRTHLLRIEPEKGKYAFHLPPGHYEFLASAPMMDSYVWTLDLQAGKKELKLETYDLDDEKGRVAKGRVAPPIRYKEASAGVAGTVAYDHFPSRWTLCYFWAFR